MDDETEGGVLETWYQHGAVKIEICLLLLHLELLKKSISCGVCL
jgi:hypothetical protein